MTLAEKILSLRTQRGMSQDDLAEKLEVSRQSVSKWETAQSTPDLDKIIRLADLFGVSVDQLVRDGDEHGGAAEPPKGGTPPAVQPQIVYVERPRRGLATSQILGAVCTAGGAWLCLLAAVKGDDELFLIGMVVLIAGLPLLLAKKHPLLIMGWLAVALVIFCMWRPLAAIWGSVFFGALMILYLRLVIPFVPTQLYKILPYVVTVIVLIASSMRNNKEKQPPASLGLAYFREDR